MGERKRRAVVARDTRRAPPTSVNAVQRVGLVDSANANSTAPTNRAAPLLWRQGETMRDQISGTEMEM